jgi:hypothetical protein
MARPLQRDTGLHAGEEEGFRESWEGGHHVGFISFAE